MALSLSYFVKNLFASSYGKDRPNFFIWHPKGTSSSEKNNAYVSGMREDLGMLGTEYNLAVTCFQVGQILGPIPANLLLTWIPPRMLLPGLELAWGALTIGTTFVTSTHQLYPIRFLVGFLEGSCFVGVQFVLGSWYKKTEIGKRTAIFACSAYVGTMVSGYLQSAMIAGMNGRNGLEAWRWVFIFDGIITVVIAAYGFFFFPDTPDKTTAFYLSAEEKARCVERLAEDGREEKNKFSLDLFKRTINTWQLYILTILWCFWNTTVGKVANTVAQLFLKNDPDHSWSVYQINNIPTSINGFNIVMVLLLNTYIDSTGCRMKAVALNLCILLFGTICLVVWDIPLGLKITAYMFAGLDGPLSPIFYSWANILTAGDTQTRALTLAVMNSCGAALTTVIQQFLYPVTDAPQFGKGFKASLGFVCGMCGWVIVVRYFEMRALAKKQAEAEVDGEGSEQEMTAVGVMAEQKV